MYMYKNRVTIFFQLICSKEGYSDLINENTNSIKYLYLYEM